ncbi:MULTISPECIES: YtxH domain-containing protein [Paenibacillus]|uniref:YtxH domain-containing protein n=1 Tax=Paenibacillus TaxID=44249 RepID=UPI00037F0922|nr:MULTISPECIES: YtxH domain-containing protein [Paenibacillus]
MNTETTKTLAIGAVTGALVGAGVAVLVAPQQGAKARAKLAEVTELVREKGPMINEKGHEIAEKGQEVVGVIKESLSTAKDFKTEAQSAVGDVKSEIQGFKQSHNSTGSGPTTM